MALTVTIPTPPSSNNLYGNKRSPSGKRAGRYRTRAYENWIERAGWDINRQRANVDPVSGPYRLLLELPRIRGDADNRIKAASDLIVSMGLVDDDRHCVACTVTVDRANPSEYARVIVTPVGEG